MSLRISFKMLLGLFVIGCIMPITAQNQFSLAFQLAKLRNGDNPLEAAIPAAKLLEKNPSSMQATNYFRNDFDDAERAVLQELADIGYPRNVSEAERRCFLYKTLVEAYNAVATLPLPLTGNGWQWQPDLKYYEGNLSEAQSELLEMLEERAEAAIAEGEPEKAAQCYGKALNSLYDTTEVESNRRYFYDKLYAKAEEKAAHEGIGAMIQAAGFYEVAYDLVPGEEILQKRNLMVNKIVDYYMQQASLAETSNDWNVALYNYEQVLHWDNQNLVAIDKVQKMRQYISQEE